MTPVLSQHARSIVVMGSGPKGPGNFEDNRVLESRILGWKQKNPEGSYEKWLAYEKAYQNMQSQLNEHQPSLSGRGWATVNESSARVKTN